MDAQARKCVHTTVTLVTPIASASTHCNTFGQNVRGKLPVQCRPLIVSLLMILVMKSKSTSRQLTAVSCVYRRSTESVDHIRIIQLFLDVNNAYISEYE